MYGDRYGWTTIRKLAGTLADPGLDEETEDLSRRLGWLIHIDEPSRLRVYRDLLATAAQGGTVHPDARDRTRAHMLAFQLNHRGVLRAAEDTVQYLADRPVIVGELEELRQVLEDRVAVAEDIYPIAEWPLALHRHYTRREIVAAVGYAVPGKKGCGFQPIVISRSTAS